MHFIVYSNFDRKKDIELVDNVINYLKTKKDVTYICASYRESGFLGHSFLRLTDCAQEADMIIVVGGDGTVLRATSDVLNKKLEIPILAINRGQIGFLTDIEASEYKEAIDKVLCNDYTLNKRMCLKATYRDKCYYALNEVVIYKGNITKPIIIEAEFDDYHHVVTMQGDGAYVSSPTGSTAYSMSCGGPILTPTTRAIVLNAICAHTLVSRPMVLSDKHTIIMHLGKGYDDACIMVDGEIKQKLYDSLPVKVSVADITANFVTIKHIDFYKKLINKLNRWQISSYTELPQEEEE